MAKYFGIDLGTTYSCISTVDESGKAFVLLNSEGENITPSVISLPSDGGFIVGSAAKDDLASEEILVEEIKRSMGDLTDIREVAGKVYNPVDLSAMILRKLKEDVEAQGEIIEGVTITCPAYFDSARRLNTKQAGISAGLNVLSVINEPTAAAYAYIDKIQAGEKKVILVYDLGGGTFDVTLLEIEAKEENGKTVKYVTTITTDGDAFLGGKDWDRAILDIIIEKGTNLYQLSRESIENDVETYKGIIRKAEVVKKQLTAKESYNFTDRWDGNPIKLEITRQELEEATSDLVGRTITFTNNVLDKLVQMDKKLDKILLVGGSTRMPMIDKALRENDKFNQVMDSLEIVVYDPDQAVAKGAAIWANIMGSISEIDFDELNDGIDEDNKVLTQEEINKLSNSQIVSYETITKSYGVIVVDAETKEDIISNIIRKDTTFDARIGYTHTEEYVTMVQNQKNVLVQIAESSVSGEKAELYEGTVIYDFQFSLPNNTPINTPVKVTFNFDPSSILYVDVEECFKHTMSDRNAIPIKGAISVEDAKESIEKIQNIERKG